MFYVLIHSSTSICSKEENKQLASTSIKNLYKNTD